jgi:hypothetical protein
MFKQTPGAMASNRLSSGEVTDFVEALDIYEEGMKWEAEDWRQFTGSLDQTEAWMHTAVTDNEELAKAAAETRRIYVEAMDEARERVIDMLNEKGRYYEVFARALDNEDYSLMAW